MIKYYSILIFLFTACASNVKDDHLEALTSEMADSTIQESTLEIAEVTDPGNQDTVFIEREITKDFYRAIYIEKNRNSLFHQRLANFEFDEYDAQNYEYGIDHFTQDLNQVFEKQDLAAIPRYWVPLYVYEDSFYLYAPSDWGNTSRKMFNDSAYVYWSMDGPNPIPLRSFEVIDSDEYLFSTALYSSEGGTQETRIYIVNQENKMAIFETENSVGKKFQKLYIPVEHINSFDIIVNYCNTQKQHEFDFKNMDLDYLLEK